MDEVTTAGPNKGGQSQRARRSLEEHFQEVESRLRPPSVLEEMKLTAARAAVWAPVAFGIGYALLKIGKRVVSPV